MSDAAEQVEQPPVKSGSSVVALAIWAVVGAFSAGLGFATPLLILSMGQPSTAAPTETKVDEPPAFIEFGEAVVNLDDGRLTRYLRINVTLQIPQEDELEITEKFERYKAILKSWLLSYLSDLTMEEIRGRAGQNRIRREIMDHFNHVLFPGEKEVIRDVLFEEFTVQ